MESNRDRSLGVSGILETRALGIGLMPTLSPTPSLKSGKSEGKVTKESKSGGNEKSDKKSDKKSLPGRTAPVVQQLNEEIKKREEQQESVMAESSLFAEMLVASRMSMSPKKRQESEMALLMSDMRMNMPQPLVRFRS